MKLEEYLNKGEDEPRTIREIITPYGFDVIVYFGYNNQDIYFSFRDSTTKNTIFVIVVRSQNEAVNLMGLFEFLVEIDL